MKVVKRNGRTEELDVSKIKKYTSEAVAGLANVSLSELEVDAENSISRYDNNRGDTTNPHQNGRRKDRYQPPELDICRGETVFIQPLSQGHGL